MKRIVKKGDEEGAKNMREFSKIDVFDDPKVLGAFHDLLQAYGAWDNFLKNFLNSTT
ncbi:MAG: hypothetical protein ABIK20_02640 [Candidatus Omnitrophota bacterium]|nr:hypothetical protein [Candidatus Omnitrophota bacterium]